MIRYKLVTTEEEFQKCAEYLVNKGLDTPMHTTKLAYASLNDEIIGVVGIEQLFVLEPLAADNGIVATKLANMVEGVALFGGADRIECFTPDEKNLSLFEKAGYKFIRKINRLVKLLQ